MIKEVDLAFDWMKSTFTSSTTHHGVRHQPTSSFCLPACQHFFVGAFGNRGIRKSECCSGCDDRSPVQRWTGGLLDVKQKNRNGGEKARKPRSSLSIADSKNCSSDSPVRLRRVSSVRQQSFLHRYSVLLSKLL